MITEDTMPPFRRSFDNARDPAAARNALGISTERLSSVTLLIPDAVPLTNGVAADIASVNLIPGPWEIWINGVFVPAATTNVTLATVSISTASATANLVPPFFGAVPCPITGLVGATGMNCIAGRALMTVTANTTVYFVALANFTVDTLECYGSIQAARRQI